MPKSSAKAAVETSSVETPIEPSKVLLLCGASLWALFLAISMLSARFDFEKSFQGRPTVFFLVLMSAAFLLHLIALRSAVRLKRHASVARWIVLFGLSFRLVLLPSVPIQEIDIYRYMWDGAVVANGSNPYQFSPRDIVEAPSEVESHDLQSVVTLRDSNHGIDAALNRIHYNHLTTIYPPVSQAVFATAAIATPKTASVRTRMIATKAAIVVFDVLAMLGVLSVLRLFRKADGWLICYAWSPLVMKEFANSGHLDAIAIGITTWAIVYWLKGLQKNSSGLLYLASCLLGLGIGAKLYPVVIVPVVAISVLRNAGIRAFLVSGMILTLVCVVTLAPMLVAKPTPVSNVTNVAQAQDAPPAIQDVPTPELPVPKKQDYISPPLPDDFDEVMSSNTESKSEFEPAPIVPPSANPVSEVTSARKETDAGLAKFMGSWKMNDFFFLILNENLTPKSKAWFSVVPDGWKRKLLGPVESRTGQSANTSAFLITRAITSLVHLAIALFLATRTWNARPKDLPHYAFLCIAWFWLLLPTLNPWYWIWGMPLLPFVRSKSWLLLSGCVAIYYLRFTLQNDYGNFQILGTGYLGANFFHYVVVWLEYLPFWILMLLEVRRKRRSPGNRLTASGPA